MKTESVKATRVEECVCCELLCPNGTVMFDDQERAVCEKCHEDLQSAYPLIYDLETQINCCLEDKA